MFIRWTQPLAITVAIVAAWFCVQPVAAQPQAIATRQNVFTIPYSVPPTNDPLATPVEVQLHLSTDGGRTWQMVRRQPPNVTKFQFRAQTDGEYLFASRTIDRQGRSRPHGNFQPELRVVIDTTSPQLDLIAQVGAAGELETSWRIADGNLKVDTFKIFYRYESRDPWQPVAVDLPTSAAGQNSLSGQTSWWPPKHGRPVSVRAEVSDTAGNTNVINRTLDLPRVAATNRPPLVDSRQSQQWQPESTPDGGVRWPVDAIGSSPLGRGGGEGRQQDDQPPFHNRTNNLASNGRTRPEPHRPHAQQPPQNAPVAPPVANQVRLEPAPGEGTYDNLPGDAVVQMTRYGRFHLDYDVQAVGPSGVARVEVWMTRNGGRLWEKLSEDTDLTSPALVEPPGPGVYGFRIVVQSNNGLTGDLPRSGDPAEVWIGIDQTAPTCEITSARYGHGPKVGELTITWRADDNRLGRAPITLLYSGTPSGPWTAIAANLPNTGSHAWQVNQNVPELIYLRLEATDEAGNTGVHQLNQPIANDGLRPRGRILRVQPVPQ